MAKTNRKPRAAKPRRTVAKTAASSAPTFGEVLEEMRDHAAQGVADAIFHAYAYEAEAKPKRRPRLAHGHRAHALFGGVTDAVAEAILTAAQPGAELEMTALVVAMLESCVHKRMCAGNA